MEDSPAEQAQASVPVIERTGVDRLVARFAHLVVSEPIRVIAIATIVSVAAAVFAFAKLRLDTDRNNLIGRDLDYNKRFMALQEEFGDLAADVVVVKLAGHDGKKPLTSDEREPMRAFARALEERLKRDPRHYGPVFYRVPEDAMRGHGLLFLELKDLDTIAQELGDMQGSLARLADANDGVGGFFEGLGAHVRKLMNEPQPQGDDAEDRGAFLVSLLGGATKTVELGAPYETPWKDMLPKEVSEKDEYVWTSDQRLLFLVGLPKDANTKTGPETPECVHALRAAVAEVSAKPEFASKVVVGVTGDAVLETDEMETYDADARKAMIFGIVGVAALLVIAYRRIAAPALLVICLLMSVAMTLAFAAIWPGYLNLLSIVFLMILVGFGIDFGIHLISRYDEERTYGMDPASALEASLRLTGRACAGGAVTTAIAFAAMLLADFQGIREFGILAGAGTIFCLLTMLGVLPAFVVLADKGRAGLKRRPRPGWARTRFALQLDWLAEHRPWRVIGASLAVTALALGASVAKLHFDGDLLSLQAQGLASVELADSLMHAEGETGMFAAVMAKDDADMQSVVAKLEKGKAKDLIARVSTIEDIVPRDQPAKLAKIKKISSLCSGIPTGGAGSGDPHARPLDKTTLPPRELLQHLAKGVGVFDSALEEAQEKIVQSGEAQKRATEFAEIGKLRDKLQHLMDVADPTKLSDAEIATRATRLVGYQKQLRDELGEAMGRLAEEGRADKPITKEDLPPDIRERFIGKSGSYLVRIFPKKDIFKDAELAEFVESVREVVPEVTWVPVQIYETSKRMKEGYERAGKYALLLIAIYLLIHFRSLPRAGITLAALIAGALVSAGVLALMGQSFNPANMLAIPLTLGINVSYAIQLVHRHRQAHAVPSVAGAPALIATSTGRGVLLSAATNVVGFGALMLAHHRGTLSIGIAITIGVLGCLSSSLVFLPALLRAWTGPTPAPSLVAETGPKIGPEGRVARPESVP